MLHSHLVDLALCLYTKLPSCFSVARGTKSLLFSSLLFYFILFPVSLVYFHADILLQNGADVEARSADQSTVLHVAAKDIDDVALLNQLPSVWQEVCSNKKKRGRGERVRGYFTIQQNASLFVIFLIECFRM